MDKTFLTQQLNNLENAKRVNRLRVANLVLKHPELFKPLLDIVFDVNNKTSIKAAWVLEFVCAEKLEWIFPYLDYFTKHISIVKFDSAIRPVAKICNFLAIRYTSKNDALLKPELKSHHIEKIIEVGFNWMISDQKVAVKAYTMNTLFLFGENSDWVHEELKLLIQQNIPKESAAYKARGRITLDLINKNKYV